MPTYITTVRIEVPDDNLGGFNATHQINGYLVEYLDALHTAEFDFEIVCSRDETPVRGKVGRPRNKIMHEAPRELDLPVTFSDGVSPARNGLFYINTLVSGAISAG